SRSSTAAVCRSSAGPRASQSGAPAVRWTSWCQSSKSMLRSSAGCCADTARVYGSGAGVGGHRLALAGFLGAVEGVDGAPEERDRVVLGLQVGDTCGDVEPTRLPDRMAYDRRLDPHEELLGLLDPRLRHDHRELVAADAARDVGGAHDLAHARGRLRQYGVAGEMPDPVVDDLEVVDVEDDQPEPAVVAVGAGAFAGERLVEVAPVVQAGQRVQIGELTRLVEALRVFDRRGGALGELFELAHVVLAEATARGAGVDGEVADPAPAPLERHGEPP